LRISGYFVSEAILLAASYEVVVCVFTRAWDASEALEQPVEEAVLAREVSWVEGSWVQVETGWYCWRHVGWFNTHVVG
jgi:hypothetical protein